MGFETAEEALTLSEAAARLGVRPQRISQMLSKGDLDGPTVASGRAPKNAGRVWVSSVEDELRRRNSGPSSDGGLAARVRTLEDRLAAFETGEVAIANSPINLGGGRAEARERAALAVASTLKVSLDIATQSLIHEQKSSAGLRREIAYLREQLDLATQRADLLDGLARTFGDSLTQLLAPDSPESI